MTVPSPHKEFKLDPLLLPAQRAVIPDMVLTELWLRLEHDDQKIRPVSDSYRYVAEIAGVIEGRGSDFEGFESGSNIAESWLKADLLKTLTKSGPKGDYTVARPVHLAATKLRNTKHSEGGASAIPFRWIKEEGGTLRGDLLDWLQGPESGDDGHQDLPSYALSVLGENQQGDLVVGGSRSEGANPLCGKYGRMYCADLRAILAYKDEIPRVAVLDHIRRITMLHLGLYLLQTFALVTRIESEPDADRECECMDDNRCRLVPEIVADCGEDVGSDVAKFAEKSWAQIENELFYYVKSHWRLRKLREFAEATENRDKNFDTGNLTEIARIASGQHREALDIWAQHRIDQLIEARTGEESERVLEARDRFMAMGVRGFDCYMSILFEDGEKRWHKYHIDLFDSVFGKNEHDGTMLQPRGGRTRRRRLTLSPSLLETIVLISFVHFGADGVPDVRPIRIDQLIKTLESRYGLLVVRPPKALEEDLRAVQAMKDNKETFLARLRQTGLYVDQSDSFLSQKIQPRIRLR